MRTANYCAFYVAEPYHSSTLGAHATRDFVFYNLLKSWKGGDATFPFSDAHDTTYNVRDGSDWETTLKPRLRARLRNSKNIVLFISDATVSSRALREEVEYGMQDQGLPVIVVYPGYSTKADLLSNGSIKQAVRNLWDKVPAFRDSMNLVPTLHVPLNKDTVAEALRHTGFMSETKIAPAIHRYNA